MKHRNLEIHPSRKLVAVMIVTAALCADRAIAAAPTFSPAVGQIASRLVDRLARKLSVSVARVKFDEVRSDAGQTAAFTPTEPIAPVGVHRVASPFQFRLPPPLV